MATAWMTVSHVGEGEYARRKGGRDVCLQAVTLQCVEDLLRVLPGATQCQAQQRHVRKQPFFVFLAWGVLGRLPWSFMQGLTRWLLVMSRAGVRAVRHTATVASLALVEVRDDSLRTPPRNDPAVWRLLCVFGGSYGLAFFHEPLVASLPHGGARHQTTTFAGDDRCKSTPSSGLGRQQERASSRGEGRLSSDCRT
eukprot:2703283-Amphidinium_carterae.2